MLVNSILIMYGYINYKIGRREMLIAYLERAITNVLYIIVIVMGCQVAGLIYSYAFSGRVNVNGFELLKSAWSENKLMTTSEVFKKGADICISWMLALGWLQASFVSNILIITSIFVPVLSISTGWQTLIMTMAIIPTFLASSVLARVLVYLAPYLLTLASVLICSDKLRSIGGALFAIYLTYAPTLVVMSSRLAPQLVNLPKPPISAGQPVHEQIFGIFQIMINPDFWLNISKNMATVVYTLYPVAIETLVALALASMMCAATSRIIGTVSIRLPTR